MANENEKNEPIVLDIFSRYSAPRRPIKVVPFVEVFGWQPEDGDGKDIDVRVERFVKPIPGMTPEINENFILDRVAVHSILSAFIRRRPLALVGLHGSGKTEHVEQVLARLNCELISLDLTEDTDVFDMIGEKKLDGNSTVWCDGPITQGFREGIPVLFNEMDYPRPGVMSKGNGYLHGQRLTLEGNGNEIVIRHQDTMFFGTGNTQGDGDHSVSLAFSGASPQNAATMSRWRKHVKEYPNVDIECEIISKACPDVPSDIVKTMVANLASDTRDAYKAGGLRVPMGTRELVMMAEVIEDTGGDLAASFKECFFNGIGDPAQQETAASAFQHAFGIDLIPVPDAAGNGAS